MERNLSDLDGHLTPRYRKYLADRATGGAALIFTEASFVRQDGKGRKRQMGVHNDSIIPPLAHLAKEIHDHGALLGIELNHGGRTAQAKVSGLQPVAPSPIPCAVAGGDLPIELDEDDILDLIEAFASAARRCIEAGVDVLSIHAAHGYLIHQFLSSRTNQRKDLWAEPTKFLDEVLDAVRAALPESAALGIRISAFEGAPGGLDADTTRALITKSRIDLVDFIDVSAGSYEGREWIVQPGEFPQGFLRTYAAKYKPLGLPVGVAGRINSPAAAEEIIASGCADFVSLARALHADPEWPRKVLEGQAPRPCIACNLCIDTLGSGEAVPCSVNPTVIDPDPDHAPSTDSIATAGSHDHLTPLPGYAAPRSMVVAILGAGPAGLEAARALASAGCTVALFEREEHIGGQFALASTMHEYPEYGRILQWYESQLRHLNVTLQLSTEAGFNEIAAIRPDAVIMATGATGHIPDIPGSKLPRVADVRSWIRAGKPILPGATHTVWGGDREAIAVADDLAQRGARVLLVSPVQELAPDVGARAKILVVPRLLSSQGVDVRLSTTVTAIDDDSLVVSTGENTKRLHALGPVLISHGVVADTSCMKALTAIHPPAGIHLVGDAAGRGGQVAVCISDAAALARRLIRELVSHTRAG